MIKSINSNSQLVNESETFNPKAVKECLPRGARNGYFTQLQLGQKCDRGEVVGVGVRDMVDHSKTNNSNRPNHYKHRDKDKPITNKNIAKDEKSISDLLNNNMNCHDPHCLFGTLTNDKQPIKEFSTMDKRQSSYTDRIAYLGSKLLNKANTKHQTKKHVRRTCIIYGAKYEKDCNGFVHSHFVLRTIGFTITPKQLKSLWPYGNCYVEQLFSKRGLLKYLFQYLNPDSSFKFDKVKAQRLDKKDKELSEAIHHGLYQLKGKQHRVHLEKKAENEKQVKQGDKVVVVSRNKLQTKVDKKPSEHTQKLFKRGKYLYSIIVYANYKHIWNLKTMKQEVIKGPVLLQKDYYLFNKNQHDELLKSMELDEPNSSNNLANSSPNSPNNELTDFEYHLNKVLSSIAD